VAWSNCLVTGNGAVGFNIGEGNAELELSDTQILDNGLHGIEVYDSRSIESDGNVLIQGNGGYGIWAKNRASVDFNDYATLTIQFNASGSMRADYMSLFTRYGPGTTGSCTADDSSMCEP